jgi:hypothetical protein
MLTDRPPRKAALLKEFANSDGSTELDLPAHDRLRGVAASLDAALQSGRRAAIQQVCGDFLTLASDFYKVTPPEIRILAARPLRVRENASIELFGDYTLQTMVIRVWTRTAVRRQITTFGTFLSTLCHEFCHHLDRQRFGFRQSPHTRGFYERTALLYHHARGTPVKPLSWMHVPGNRWRIDWQRMNTIPRAQ